MAPSLQDLTVSDVSGMIAAAIAAVQIFNPVALPVILLGSLELTNSALTLSAVTWSVLARELQSSYWPSILRTDSSTTSGVLKSVSIVSWSKTIAKLLTAIAAVVTPLGLYEDISPQTTPKLVPFHYIDDKSPFGIGTPPREIDMRFSRICGGFYPVGCPNSHTNVTSFSNATGIYVSGDWYDSHIPQYVINSFESGISSMAPSVSSVFDIQSRYQTWAQAVESNDTIPIDNNTAYPVSVFRQIGSLIVNGGIQLLEGLVVDLQSGGVGFRNHTAPPWQPFGSTWSEDLLFIQPDTECVNLNLTLDFNVPRSFSLGGSGFSDLVLTDRGGFSRIQQNSPLYSTNVGSQKDPDMFNRAYAAAWVNNFLSMLFLNITNPAEYNNSDSGAFQYLESSVGKQFPLMRNGTSESSFSFLQHAPMSVNIDSLFGYYLSGADYAYPGINTTGFNVTGLGDNFTDPQPALYPNPFQITEENFTAAGAICKRTTQYDYANISNIATACGMIYGVPQRQSLGNPLIFDPGSNWSIPMYTCATATKALIKTVTFQFNGSDDLSGLKVTQISEKVYPDGTSMPLWAVENTNLSMSDVAPLWGLVTPDTARQINISSVRQEGLWLPGTTDLGSLYTVPRYQNLPGVNFYVDVLAGMYGSGYDTFDYSGASSYALLHQWQQLTQTSPGSAHMMNLIWTDLAANYVLGTRSLLSSLEPLSTGNSNNVREKRIHNKRQDEAMSPNFPVTLYERRVRYHVLYGIPAFLLLALTTVTLVCATWSVIRGSGLGKMRTLLNRTSVGRIVNSSNSESEVILVSGIPSRKWIRVAGKHRITLTEQLNNHEVSDKNNRNQQDSLLHHTD